MYNILYNHVILENLWQCDQSHLSCHTSSVTLVTSHTCDGHTCHQSHLSPVTLVTSHTCHQSHLSPVIFVISHTCHQSHLSSVTLVTSHTCHQSHLSSVTLVTSHTCHQSHLSHLWQCDGWTACSSSKGIFSYRMRVFWKQIMSVTN